MMSLTVNDTQNGAAVATLYGELTTQTVAELKDDLFGLLNFRTVSLDLTSLTDYDGCGLQLVSILLAEADRAGRAIHLHPINIQVQESMRLLGFVAPTATKDV